MEAGFVIYIVMGAAVAFGVALAITPLVRKLSIKIGAVDVPRDGRRMHSKPVPTMGGLAIFVAFAVSMLIFVPLERTYAAMLLGALIITLTGVLDDVYGLRWWMKVLGQVGAALVVALNGIRISELANGDIQFGVWAVPVTVLWIVAITNAINLLDGLDGLACGIMAISCVSLLIVSSFYIEPQYVYVMVIIAVLAGSCFGFLPYNLNPAKIFMGDTGAMFIGYTFSVIAIQGFFKLNALVSFGVPFLVLGLPILDTLLAIVRRALKGQHFFQPDRKHMHHKLMEWGFNQKQTVGIMYVISAALGVAAVLFAKRYFLAFAIVLIAALGIGVVVIRLQTNKIAREKEAAEQAAGSGADQVQGEKQHEGE
ncbi:undecaprenyl/decaprenyl-phosphate alpha-N-acetylglucosaminyl 1-phosphate transferase [Christensenellaceae bacterium OttesenSCG-928-K19]|nr:undecaprenyl/decaprenyl-phosphate alpha-N-acetylglucosaminyl 1-phosphate transferase [Christensenellaceae bacterium OttesenSCG-928-K19]